MATGGLYGQSSAGIVSPQSGSESSGLYGNNTVFGGSYFEWFIFQVADTQPATPTGGSWSFTTNSGTPPTGWLATPPVNPTNTVWVSVGLVNSKSTSAIVWSTPGKFSFASGLPILSGASAPLSGDGQTDQLYIETGTTPETIWFKQTGTWTRLTGSSLYVDLSSNQTINGTKTFSNQIQGSVSGTSSNVTGIVDITHGGTGSTTASAARTALGAAASGANSDITSLTGLTTPLSITQGGTGANTASGARANLSAAILGANNDITSMSSLTGGIASPTNIDMGNGNAVTVTAGRMTYTPNTGSWNLGMGNGNITQQVGEELFKYGKASSAITDSPLQIVYQTGTVGGSGVVTFAPTVSGITDGNKIIGIATESLAINAFGRITTFGTVHGITTDGSAYGETWADNDVIWYNPVTGNPTNVKPSAPNIKVSLGTIIKAGPGGSGSFDVEINHGSILGGTDANVQFGTLATNNLIQYNGTYWTNVFGPASQIVGISDTQTLTNKTISGASNTLSNIGNSSLTNSSITINGSAVSLGGSTTVTAVAPNALTIGTGLSGTSYNGSAAVTIAIDSTVATLTGIQTLTNKSISGSTNTLTNIENGSLTNSSITFGATAQALGSTVSALNAITIGATTASTGAFTTLAASGAVTLSGGTANGVGYLNASKVLTTGSALTFDGSVLSNTGLGVNINNANALLRFQNGSGTRTGYLQVRSDAFEVWSDQAAVPLVFGTANAEQMRLTSTGLGIGTSSPSSKLDVVVADGSTAPKFIAATGRLRIRPYADATNGAVLDSTNTAEGAYLPLTLTGSTLRLFGGGGAGAVIDTSGNLGLGVTPSAWGSTWKASQIGAVGALASTGSGSTSPAAMVLGAYNDNTNWKYQYSSVGAARYEMTGANAGSTHAWYVAAGGTAGNAITFTQALTLDANGKLLVGLTSSGSTNAVLQTNGPANFKGYTVATLPTGTVGDRAYVTDAVTAVFQAIPTGGGSVKTPVFYNGSNWVCG